MLYFVKMTSSSKQRTDRNNRKNRRKTSFQKEQVETAGSYKPVWNKIMTTYK